MSTLSVRLIPVGKADCILIKFPDESWAVVDCGSTKNDSGALMAFSALRDAKPKNKRVRFVLATHPDEDHCLGIPTLLRLCTPQIKIDAFYHSGARLKNRPGKAPAELEVINVADRLVDQGRIGVSKRVKSGDVLLDGIAIPGITVSVLNPPDGSVPDEPIRSGESNDLSVTLLITYGRIQILLAGDIGKAGWAKVIAHPHFRHPNVLKLPHHGALNGMPPKFILDEPGAIRWALLSTSSGDKTKPHAESLAAFWSRSTWKTRCTGLSPHCDIRNGVRYPMQPDDPNYPHHLKEMLEFERRHSIYKEGGQTTLGCCVDNEILISNDGQIRHSVESKTCDSRVVQ